ncbi:FMN-dependent NADH-azoreductase [Sciscionella marina]|uniref:FMN-dependent NADH-azoreductase n=1 Tax=Sciscionella marina TaxID=508770 RepID=UPI00036561DC|nr:NAD(P)H-dependent oxidoreductase [Sciscionella marina]
MTETLTEQRTPGLLHLDASHAADSVSKRLAGMFARTWRDAGGAGGYRYRDLAAEPVPLIGPAYCALGMRVERSGVVAAADVPGYCESGAERREWAQTRPLVAELRAARVLLLGVPMYNFSVPASLKAWIDRVGFPGIFTDPVTGADLLAHTTVVAVLARGGRYGPGSPREHCDFQEPYLRAHFGKLGVRADRIHVVAAELTRAGDIPTLAGCTEQATRSSAAARERVRALATELAEGVPAGVLHISVGGSA